MRKYLPVLIALFVSVAAAPAFGQSAEGARTVGRKGAKQLSLSFATFTQISSTEGVGGFEGGTSTSTNIFGAVDFGRFVTNRFVLSFGLSGSGTVKRGSTPLFYTNGSAAFYFTPQKASSAYFGGEVSTPLSQTEGVDIKPEVLGKLGVQTAIKENASLFVEGAYGGPVDTLGSSGSLRTRVGLRVLF